MIEAFRIGVSIIMESNAGRQVGELSKQFESLNQIIKSVQVSVKELESGMKTVGRAGATAATEWRNAAAAMERAAVAAKEASRSMPKPGVASEVENAAIPGQRSRRSGSTSNRSSPAGTYQSGTTIEGELAPGPRAPAGLLAYEATQTYGAGEKTFVRSPSWRTMEPFVSPESNEPNFTLHGDPYTPYNGTRELVTSKLFGTGETGPMNLGELPPWERASLPPLNMPNRKQVHTFANETVQGLAIPDFMGFEILKHLYEAQMPIGEVEAGMMGQGFSPAQAQRALKAAFDTQQKVKGTSVGGNLSLTSKIMAVTQDPEAALSLTPDFAQLGVMLDSFGQGEEGNQLMAAIRAGEFRGVLTHFNEKTGKDDIDPDKLKPFLHQVMAADFVTHGDIGPTKILQMLRSGSYASAMLNDQALFADSMAFMMAMGPARAGSGLLGFSQQFSSGRMSQAGAQMLIDMGVIHGGGTAKHNPYLRPMGPGQMMMLPGAMDQDKQNQARDQPVEFIMSYMLPKIREYNAKVLGKAYTGADHDRKSQMDWALWAQLSSRIPGGNYGIEAQRNYPLMQRDRTALTGAMNRDIVGIENENNPMIAQKAFTASLNAFQIALGQSSLKNAMDALNYMSKILNEYSDWARKNPEGTKTALKLFAEGLAAFGVGTAAAGALSVLTGKGGLFALSFGIESLGHSLTSLPGWLIDAVAGAAGGYRAAGPLGAVLGAVGAPAVHDMYDYAHTPESQIPRHRDPFTASGWTGTGPVPPEIKFPKGQMPVVPPAPSLDKNTTIKGDVNIDGKKMGTWQGKVMGNNASKPVTGPTGFDASQAAAYQAIPGGF